MIEIAVAIEVVPEDSEAVLIAWLYENGAAIEAGEPVAEIMLEKATIEVLAPRSGRLRHLKNPEDILKTGDVLGIID